jgi:hypothetical protein
MSLRSDVASDWTVTLAPMSDAAPQVTYVAFAFADVFPADDPLSEWLTTAKNPRAAARLW